MEKWPRENLVRSTFEGGHNRREMVLTLAICRLFDLFWRTAASPRIAERAAAARRVRATKWQKQPFYSITSSAVASSVGGRLRSF
jgi:hypothetical protein